ncbi:MAG: sulfatase-like hydrolase/transferase [Proteobacteria bacterium]|nr:sulfatase-like hydrolase/transferase [Pseudomonadota bacterium]
MKKLISYLSTIISYEGLAFTVPLGAIFLIETFVFKAVQIINIMGNLSILSVLSAIAPDIVFIIITTLIAAALFSRSAKIVTIFVSILFYTCMTYALIISTFNNGYFLATGSYLSWSVIEYWYSNMFATNEIIASEASTGRVVILGAQIVFILLCGFIPHIGKARNWFQRKKPIEHSKVKWIAIITLVLLVVFLVIPSPKGKAMIASRCIPISIVSGFVKDRFFQTDDIEIAEEHLQSGILEFEKEIGAQRPNIVFIILESVNWKSTDIYFPGRGTTPFLAKIAKEGMVVDYNYAVVPHTSKALAPILCGIYPSLLTEPLEAIPGILPRRCLAHILGDLGYSTAFFQPAYAFEGRNKLVANLGFEIYKGIDEMPREGFEKVSYFGSEDKVMIKPSMEWVDSVKDEPFFLTYLTLSTHHNYITPQTFPYVEFDTKDKDWSNFFNAVRYVDDTVREIFEEFEERGLIDNTIFFLMGDHGEAFAEHARRQHDLVLWEEGIRSAAMIYGPKFLPKGDTIKGLRSNLDFLPTVLDILGLNLKKGHFIGQSMLKPVPADRKLFHSCWFKQQCLAIHDGPVKTIFHYETQPMEVYNDFKDPFENNDLAFLGRYTEEYLEAKKREMIYWKKSIDQQYRNWKLALEGEKVTDQEPPVANKLAARFGDAIELIGYEIPKRAIAGQDIRLKYVFKCLEELSEKERLFVHITHKSALKIADHTPVNGKQPLHKWKPGQYIVDEHTVKIPANWSSGNMQLLIGFGNIKTKKLLKIKDTSAPVDKSRLLVAEIPLIGSKRESTVNQDELRENIKDWIGFEKPSFEKEAGAIFGDTIEFVGMTPERMNVMIGGTVEMTYVFRAQKSIPRSWRLNVQLVRDDGFTIGGTRTPISGLYPLYYWREGEYVTDKHKQYISIQKSKTGTYTAWLGFTARSESIPVKGRGEFDSQNRVRLGTVTITKKDARQ